MRKEVGPMPRDDCGGEGAARQPCCRRRGGGGGALVEPAALAALLYAGGYGYDMRKAILERTNGEVDVDVVLAIVSFGERRCEVVTVFSY